MNIIGQTELLKRVSTLIEEDNWPRFVIFYGPKGSGRKLLSNYVADKLGARFVPSDVSVASVREVITLSYEQTEPTVYLFGDADRMSAAAKNALLKVTEEPPLQSYFIMTVEDLGSTLGTLISRCNSFQMEPYTPEELIIYANTKGYILNEEEKNILCEVCVSPQDVDGLCTENVTEFYSFANKVLDLLATTSESNSLKIPTYFRYKEDDEKGYDPILFLRVVKVICANRIMSQPSIYWREVIHVTNNYLSDMRISGINKQSTLDLWVLKVRTILAKMEGVNN